MPAHEKVHPVQFKLFMSGREWMNSVSDSVDLDHGEHETMEELWDLKTDESKMHAGSGHGAGIFSSMSKHGYDADKAFGDAPTILVSSRNQMVQGEGHHRIAAAAEIERETGKQVWIPTNYETRRYY